MNKINRALLGMLGGSDGITAGFLRWSSLSTWGGAFPTPGAPLTIAPGVNILLDVEMADADAPGIITNNGKILFDPTKNTRLIAAGIDNSGEFFIGTEGLPHSASATIDLCGARPTVSGNAGGGALKTGLTHDLTTDASTGNNGTTNDYGGVSRGFINNPGGKLKLYGAQAPTTTRLNAHYASGTSITVADFVTAPAGARVLVTPSGFYDAAKRTEVRTLAVAAVNTKTLVLNAALGFARWGLLQYMTDSGMSLTQGAFTLKTGGNPGGMRTHADQDPTIDQRAFVCVIAPKIKIRGYDHGNTDLAGFGFGFQGMSMGLTSETVIKNVGMENYGQLALLGRYGWHFHIPSYNANGTNKTDGYLDTNKYATGAALIEGVSGINGFNRFMDLHACRGVKMTKCIGYEAAGHAFFEEDGSEEENEVSYNVSIAHRDPGFGNRLKVHEETPAGFWFANPNNTHLENWAVDSAGRGWWNAHSRGLPTRIDEQHGCVGFSANVPITPLWGKRGVWSGNSALGCAAGCLSNEGPGNNAGSQTGNEKLRTTSDGLYNSSLQLPFLLEKFRIYKGAGYSNAVFDPAYAFPVLVDHTGEGFSGVTTAGSITNAIGVRESLNHEINYLANTWSAFWMPYHGTINCKGLTASGYKGAVYSTNGGNHGAVQKVCVQGSWDSYTQAVEEFPVASTGWAIRDSDGIWQTPPAHLTQAVTTYDYITGTAAGGPKFITQDGQGPRRWSLGVVFDPYGFLSTGPSQAGVPNSHIVWNQPFFTTGITLTPLQNNPESGTTLTPYMGMDAIGAHAMLYTKANHFQRTDSAGAVIAGAIWSQEAFTGEANEVLGGFHHGSCPVGGFVKWTWPGVAVPTTAISGSYWCAGQDAGNWGYANPNLNVATDVTYWGISWGAATANFSCGGQAYNSTGVTSLASLQASSGYKCWLDTANKFLWVRLRVHGGHNWSITP